MRQATDKERGGTARAVRHARGNGASGARGLRGRRAKRLPAGDLGGQAASTDGNGVRRGTLYGDDGFGGRTVTEIDGLGYHDTLYYDPAGRLVKTTDRNRKSTTYTYDAAGRMLSETDALGGTAHRAYDWLGRMAAATDRNGNTTTYDYDMNGNLTVATDALGGVSVFAYDAMDRLANVRQGIALEQETVYTYDYRGLLLTETDPLGTAKSYQYDLAGRLAWLTDGGGYAAAYHYDAIGRTVQVSYTGGGATDRTSHSCSLRSRFNLSPSRDFVRIEVLYSDKDSAVKKSTRNSDYWEEILDNWYILFLVSLPG